MIPVGVSGHRDSACCGFVLGFFLQGVGGYFPPFSSFFFGVSLAGRIWCAAVHRSPATSLVPPWGKFGARAAPSGEIIFQNKRKKKQTLKKTNPKSKFLLLPLSPAASSVHAAQALYCAIGSRPYIHSARCSGCCRPQTDLWESIQFCRGLCRSMGVYTDLYAVVPIWSRPYIPGLVLGCGV